MNRREAVRGWFEIEFGDDLKWEGKIDGYNEYEFHTPKIEQEDIDRMNEAGFKVARIEAVENRDNGLMYILVRERSNVGGK